MTTILIIIAVVIAICGTYVLAITDDLSGLIVLGAAICVFGAGLGNYVDNYNATKDYFRAECEQKDGKIIEFEGNNIQCLTKGSEVIFIPVP